MIDCKGFGFIKFKLKPMETEKSRTVYIDYLRVFATFAVIVIHVAASNWRSTDVNETPWHIFNIFDSISRWGVPIFVMISGALFLGRDIPLKTLYSKYILRLVCAFVAWSLFYAIISGGRIRHILLVAISGHYHMWFILMMMGVYICIPLLRLIVDKGWRTHYYLAIAFLFAFAIPEAITLSNDFGNEVVKKGMAAVSANVAAMQMNYVLGFFSYFILGYCIAQAEFNKIQRRIIYLLGLVGFLFTIVVTAIVSMRIQEPCENYYNNFSVNVLLESISVFIAFKYSRFLNDKINRIVQLLAKYSFGAYLIHPFIIKQLNKQFGLNTLSFNPIFSVILISIIVSIVSFCISAALNKIPVVNKCLV